MKRIGLLALLLTSSLAFLQPVAMAGDRDDYYRDGDRYRHERREWREHERRERREREWREHEWRERERRENFYPGERPSYYAPAPYAPARGYYDAYGVWHAYR